jgi:hypothetical protein
MLDEMSLAFGPVNQGTSGHSIVTIMDDPKFEKEFGKMYDLVETLRGTLQELLHMAEEER